MGRYPMPATPDGWYAVGASSEWAVGDVRPLHYFGRDLVAFRAEDGAVRVFEAHCPHLGAHLGHGGRVCGDGIACPFHGWRFDGAGRLAEVPGLGRRPPRAGLEAWPVLERNGFVFAFQHALGEAPDWQVPPVRDGAHGGPEWTPWATSAHRVRVHVQELTENILDVGHFRCVHDMEAPGTPHFRVSFDGPRMVVEQRLRVTAAGPGVEILSRTTSCGPGVAAVDVRQGALEMLTYITQTPVDDEEVDVRLHFSMKRLADDAATERLAALNARITVEQFHQDVPIWEHKVYRERPLLTEVDGPVVRYRRWYRQFYSDPGDPPGADRVAPR